MHRLRLTLWPHDFTGETKAADISSTLLRSTDDTTTWTEKLPCFRTQCLRRASAAGNWQISGAQRRRVSYHQDAVNSKPNVGARCTGDAAGEATAEYQEQQDPEPGLMVASSWQAKRLQMGVFGKLQCTCVPRLSSMLGMYAACDLCRRATECMDTVQPVSCRLTHVQASTRAWICDQSAAPILSLICALYRRPCFMCTSMCITSVSVPGSRSCVHCRRGVMWSLMADRAHRQYSDALRFPQSARAPHV
jgi:hypothetical protein